MKASELNVRNLMDGNWIMPSNNEKFIPKYLSHPVQLDIDIRLAANMGDVLEDYSPIPLTPELLEKAGFVFTSVGYWLKLPDRFNKFRSIEVAYNNDNSTNQYYCYYRQSKGVLPEHGDSFVQLRHDLQYIHQLQNLFYSLTGKELTIEL